MSDLTVARGEAVAREAQDHAEAAVRQARPWVTALGRVGYVACGIVYALVGFLAGQAALGSRGDTTDAHGALGSILEAPFGRLLLGLIAAGLVGYALWRFLQAALDTDNEGSDLKG